MGCSGLIIDRSTDAFAARDYTVVSSCNAAPGDQMGMASGVDSCRFTEGDTVSGNWVLIAPKPKTAQQVTGGTIDLYYKDLHKAYSVTDWVVPVSFADFFGVQTWPTTLDKSIISALLTLNWVDNVGVNHVTNFKGLAVLLVTQPGYDRMPMDSGNSAWGTTCSVQYSTAGRSAYKCQ